MDAESCNTCEHKGNLRQACEDCMAREMGKIITEQIDQEIYEKVTGTTMTREDFLKMIKGDKNGSS